MPSSNHFKTEQVSKERCITMIFRNFQGNLAHTEEFLLNTYKIFGQKFASWLGKRLTGINSNPYLYPNFVNIKK